MDSIATRAKAKAKKALGPRRDAQDLKRRVAELEREMQEMRRLNRRLAELTDVVQELLLPVAQRNEDVLRSRLDDYQASL